METALEAQIAQALAAAPALMPPALRQAGFGGLQRQAECASEPRLGAELRNGEPRVREIVLFQPRAGRLEQCRMEAQFAA